MQSIASGHSNLDRGVRSSNSDVYKSQDGKCIKHYFELDKQQVEKYNLLQENLSHTAVTLDLELGQVSGVGPLEFTSQDLFLDNISQQPLKIHTFCFGTQSTQNHHLAAATDIESKEEIVAQESEFIDGKTLFDLCMSENVDYDKKIGVYHILQSLNQKIQQQTGIDTSCDNPQDKFQIQGINCKIIDVINGVLFIRITDTARNISELLEKNNQKIHEILSK